MKKKQGVASLPACVNESSELKDKNDQIKNQEEQLLSLSHTHVVKHTLQTHRVHTSSSFTAWSVSIGSSPSAGFTTSTSEALETLKTPWTLTRTLTLTFELSPDDWGPTFWIRNWPVGWGLRSKPKLILSY